MHLAIKVDVAKLFLTNIEICAIDRMTVVKMPMSGRYNIRPGLNCHRNCLHGIVQHWRGRKLALG